MTKIDHVFNKFIEFEAQAKKDKPLGVLNQEWIRKLLADIDAAPGILKRPSKDKREGLVTNIRAVQTIAASIASQ